MSKQSEVSDSPRQTSLVEDLWALGRYGLGSRAGKLLIGAVILAIGLYLGWDWLVAAGLAPIVLSLLPCAAMCAAGLCMKRTGGDTCSSAKSDIDHSAADPRVESQVDGNDHEPLTKSGKE